MYVHAFAYSKYFIYLLNVYLFTYKCHGESLFRHGDSTIEMQYLRRRDEYYIQHNDSDERDGDAVLRMRVSGRARAAAVVTAHLAT